DEDFISIATGARQPIARAPAVASVVTAEDIKRMGATTLDEVLETVAGLHVSLSSLRFSPIYSIRGIYTDTNPHVLVLVNGSPMTQLFAGDRGIRSTLPVNNISRIEIIRGPGSAVYGADAFAGVINVITKTAQDINGLDLGLRAGSFDTREAWLQLGDSWKKVDVAFSLQWSDTDGDDSRIIEQDAQTGFDQALGTRASLAPGPAATQQERLDLNLDLGYDNWRLQLWKWRQYKVGTGPGVALALDSGGKANADNFKGDLRYRQTLRDSNWDVDARLGYMDIDSRSEQTLFPKNSKLPIGNDGNINPLSSNTVTFTDGVIGNPGVFETHYRADVGAFYTGIDAHRIRLGSGYAYAKLRGTETKNFGPGVIDGTEGTVNGSLTDVTGTDSVFIAPHSRRLRYVFLQDEWSFTTDWDLVWGVRYDHYSDFGETVNPRAALIWQTAFDLTTKLLYGKAFRAPSFAELFSQNNPIREGNKNLLPETVETYELAFDYQPIFDLATRVNLYYYVISDLISPELSGQSFVFQNVGRQSGRGIEWELDWKVTPTLRLSANYAFVDATNERTGSNAGNSPQHQLYGRLNWTFAAGWQLTPELNWVGKRKRVAGDPRPPLDSYLIANAMLRYDSFDQTWQTALGLRNLFDQDAREPSPAQVPGDFPLPERSVYLEFRYHL
ncbi:MAG TPA: TonB-dependent receptor, partial [Gammaproteobacteria bacterium]|nr:TonB-dependent receptor [Gammaproteobacteria bacterium]